MNISRDFYALFTDGNILKPNECISNDNHLSNVEVISFGQTPAERLLNCNLIWTHDHNFLITEHETLQKEGSFKIHVNSSKDNGNYSMSTSPSYYSIGYI